jgi:cytochrome b561
MLPDIGLMIAAYIVTRMVALLGQPRPQANPVAKVFAAITILVAVVCALDLVLRGVIMPGNIPALR